MTVVHMRWSVCMTALLFNCDAGCFSSSLQETFQGALWSPPPCWPPVSLSEAFTLSQVCWIWLCASNVFYVSGSTGPAAAKTNFSRMVSSKWIVYTHTKEDWCSSSALWPPQIIIITINNIAWTYLVIQRHSLLNPKGLQTSTVKFTFVKKSY